MITDKALEFSNAQALTASAMSTDILDLGGPTDVGMSCGPVIYLQGSAALASAGATTLEAQIQVSDVENFASFKTAGSSGPVAKADLVGKQVFIPVMPGIKGRFIRLSYIVATGPFTAGTVSAGFTSAIQANIAYPDAL